MNIAGFILFSIFAAVAFFLAKIMKTDVKKESREEYRNCNTATVTVKFTETKKNREGRYRGYYYQVEFVDHNGNEAVGKSELFTKKRTLEKEQVLEAYYWQEEETETSKKMQEFVDGAMNAMTTTLFDKPYEPDQRPKYRIHFCDERVYEKEKKAGNRSATGCFVFGCAMIVMAFVMLFKG